MSSNESTTILPDGSAFAIWSLPLPEDHWLTAPQADWDDDRDTLADTPTPILTHALREHVIAAARYAIRGATANGTDMDFDPDAMVKNFCYALCGPFSDVNTKERAEKALKEAQDEPVAWLCGADVAQNKDYAEWFTAFTKESAIPLYARPVPAAPAVAVPAVPDEWRDVLRECADDLAIELDMRYQSRSHYPSELRKYENEMQPVYRARSLLQSADHSELAIEKVAPDCRACAILPCSCK